MCMQQCIDPCCDPLTCGLASGAVCVNGPCCDSSTCQFQPRDFLCRASAHECDIADYCTGADRLCPDDLQVQTGNTCTSIYGDPSICFEGSCVLTRDEQCDHHFCESEAACL